MGLGSRPGLLAPLSPSAPAMSCDDQGASAKPHWPGGWQAWVVPSWLLAKRPVSLEASHLVQECSC